MHKKTPEEFEYEVYNLVGDEYTFLDDYVNASTKIKVKHNFCGTIYSVTPHLFLRGHRCPYCSGNLKLDTTIFKQKVFEFVGDEYTVEEEYININTPIKMKHNICGKEYKVRPSCFLHHQNRCPYCANRVRKTTEQFKKEVYDAVGDEYIVIGEYINGHTKILIQHTKCGYKYTVQPVNFLYLNYRCPYCSKKLHKSTEMFKEEVFELVGGEYEVLGEYKNAYTKIEMKHLVCNNTFSLTPHNFLSCLNRCPYCGIKSKGEHIIIEKLNKENIDFKYQYYRKTVRPSSPIKNKGHKFDFYLPQQKVYIEFDGKQHFIYKDNLKEEFDRNRQYDLEINEYIKRKGETCIRIKYTAIKELDEIINHIIINDFQWLKLNQNLLVVDSSVSQEEENRYFAIV